MNVLPVAPECAPSPALSVSPAESLSNPAANIPNDPQAEAIAALGKCELWTHRILIAGFGSIGRGVLPLLLRHLELLPHQVTILTAEDREKEAREAAANYGVHVLIQKITVENYRELMPTLLSRGDFLINLTVEVCSLALMEWCRTEGVLYLDTVAEPWLGGYTDPALSQAARTNLAQREHVLRLRETEQAGAPTAVSCHGANPGLVSHFVKKAMLNIARDTGLDVAVPATRAQWAALAHTLDIRAIHISERDTQVMSERKRPGEFVNTWSVNGFVSEGSQPAELGWGTHERTLPHDAGTHKDPQAPGIFLNRCGAATKVRTWAPLAGPFHGFLITHNEALSIADYLSVKREGHVVYRPTVHYAYHPCDDAVLSVNELAATEFAGKYTERLISDEIVSGIDELGVLLMGHQKNAYWYGSRLDIDTARSRAKYNSATSLQVTAAVLAAVVWAIRNPTRGLVEADEMPFDEILAIAQPYVEPVVGKYTDWTPLQHRGALFAEPHVVADDPFQFANIRVL